MAPLNIVICLVTCPSRDVGSTLAKMLVNHRLAACVNIIPHVESVYRWKEDLCIEEEALLIIKTTDELVEQIKNFIVEHHPYEVPEFIALRSSQVSEPYAQWIFDCVAAPKKPDSLGS